MSAERVGEPTLDELAAVFRAKAREEGEPLYFSHLYTLAYVTIKERAKRDPGGYDAVSCRVREVLRLIEAENDPRYIADPSSTPILRGKGALRWVKPRRYRKISV